MHLGVAISEHSGASLSLGRLDQYLYPLFEADRQSGMPEAEIEAALADLFRALNTMGDPACTINLGGEDSAGADMLNPLSMMIVKVAKGLHLPSPLLAARVHDGLSDEAFDVLTDPGLLEMGQPTFYGEQPCRRALLRRGVPGDDVHQWAANSCMGLMMPGQEWSNMWGSVINVLLPLELALNHGQPFLHEIPITLTTRTPRRPDTFEELFETAAAYMAELVDLYIAHTAARTERRGGERPNPFVSALLDDCIERGRDRLLAGCRYHTVIVEAFGLVNASDALLAVRRLAFEQQRYSLEAMVEAAKANFEDAEDLLHELRRVPKYGNGDPDADAMALRLAQRFAQAVSRHSDRDMCYAPSFHTLSAHIRAGQKTAASLDGRLAGAPLAKNVGTTPGTNREGHTALMRSAAAVDQSAFYGGQALDISLDRALVRTPQGRRKLQALLRSYFQLGGLQVQVNAVSPDTLRAAMAEPESHRDVLVRKAGFTARYVTLPLDEQRELIDRFEAGL